MITKQELSPFVKKVSVLEVEVKNLVIKSQEDMKKATVLLSTLNRYGDSVTEAKEKLTKPLNASLKAIRDMFKPVEVYKEMIETIRERMTAYQTEEVKRQREEETKIANRIGEGKGKIKIETALRKMDEIQKVDKEVLVENGAVQFREIKVLKLTDVNLIPREYLVPDEKKLLESLKKGIVIPGAELEMIMTPVNYR